MHSFKRFANFPITALFVLYLHFQKLDGSWLQRVAKLVPPLMHAFSLWHAASLPPVVERLCSNMEDELRCPVCKQFFNNPVLLPCYHALCLNCAVHLQQPASQHPPPTQAAELANESAGGGGGGGSNSSGGGSELGVADYQEVDKLSILSETDSGVVCNSRPNSYVGTPNIQGLLFPPLASSALSLACPICHKVVYFDENGAHNLPKYRAMQSIVDKYGETRNLSLKCQLCETEPAEDATAMCEQCEVLYCDACRENCHPSRGPLAKHTLLEPLQGRAALRNKTKTKDVQCSEHEDEALSMYCMVCKVPVCPLCLHDTRHTSHDVQAINSMCKAQKVRPSPLDQWNVQGTIRIWSTRQLNTIMKLKVIILSHLCK